MNCCPGSVALFASRLAPRRRDRPGAVCPARGTAWAAHWLARRVVVLAPLGVVTRMGADCDPRSACCSVFTTLPGAAPAVSSLRRADLLYMELGTILLFSWLENTATAQPTARNVPAFHFNSVGINQSCWLLFQLATVAAGDAGSATSQVYNQSALADLPFKFRNIIANRLLAPGEQVEAAVYRPPLWSGGHGSVARGVRGPGPCAHHLPPPGSHRG